MKKKFLCCFFICLSIFAIFSEGYKIENVEYELTGLTRENSLKSKIPVDTTTVFPSEKELEEYMNELSRDIIEMISDATPDQKVLLAQKLNTLASKVQ